VVNHAFKGVFHRDNAVIQPAPFHSVKNIRYPPHWDKLCGKTELLYSGKVSECAFRSEITYALKLLKGKRSGDNLPVNSADSLKGQRSMVYFGKTLINLLLTGGNIEGLALFLLYLADFHRFLRTGVQKVNYFGVDSVNFFSVLIKFIHPSNLPEHTFLSKAKELFSGALTII